MSISIELPEGVAIRLEHVVLDVNGTLAERGTLIAEVPERLAKVADALEVHLLSADTFGTLDAVARELGVARRTVTTGSEKAAYVRELGSERCVVIGNGVNDVAMLEAAVLGIAVIGPEGVAGAAVRVADVICGSVTDALELLLDQQALVATLRA